MTDIRFTIPALPVLLPAALATAALLWLRLRRRGRVDFRVLVPRLAFVAYAAGVLRATLFPVQIIIGLQANRGPWINGVNLVPSLAIDQVGFLLNMLLFAPLGMLLFRCWRRASVIRTAVVALLASLAIELTQLGTGVLFDSGRLADVNDLLANTSGAVAGFLLVRLAAARLGDRRRRRLRRALAARPVDAPVSVAR
jgi:glycopeptide antibiotics resistance protein